MKKTALYIQLLMAALVMASCNLFIDEELDTNYGDVPERTGNEYDNVVSAEGDGCTINYQLKRDVRHLGERDLQYIRYVQRDEIGALIEIHYAADTPEELLPVPGEVLLCGVNDKFDWGCSHRLKNRYFEDGVYKFLGTICSVKEVYETLEIDGQLTTTETEEYYVVPDADEGEEPSEARTRADDGGDEALKVAFEDDGFTFNFSWCGLELATDYGDFGVTFSMPSETNFTKITVEAVFDNFSLDNPEFQIIKTIEEQNEITLKGTWQQELGFKKKAMRWHPVKGKVFSCPPLVVVFFVDVELHPTIGFSASAKITRHQKVVVTYTVNLYDATCKQTEKKIIDEPWKVEGELTFSLGLEFDLSIGFGFYGKVFSVRLVPYLNLTFEASFPLTTQNVYDASSGKGLDFTVELGGRIRFVVDFTFDNLFGSSKTVEEARANLQKAAELYDEQSEFYNSMKEYEKTFGTTDTDDFNSNQDKEWGINIEVCKVKLFTWNITWYPVISDESFTITKYWETPEKLALRSQFKIKKLGLAGSTKIYHPALRIMDGTKQIAVVYPEEGGKDACIERGKTYHFTLSDLPPSRQLTAVPSYYYRVFGNDILEAVDKGQTFYTVTPSVTIDEVKPTDFIVDNEGRYASKNGKMFMYIFKLESKAKVEGRKNIYSWGLYEKVSKTTHSSSKAKSDGTYTIIWRLFARTNIPTTLQTLKQHVDVIPRYRLEDDGNYETEKEGPHYEIMIYSNGTYDIIDDGSGLSMEGLTYEIKGEAPARRYRNLPSVLPDERDDVETEVVIDKIIDPDGEVVYECPDSQTI